MTTSVRRETSPGLARPAGSVKVRLTQGMKDRLRLLLHGGLHGNTVAEVAERLICRQLIEMMREERRQ